MKKVHEKGDVLLFPLQGVQNGHTYSGSSDFTHYLFFPFISDEILLKIS